MLALVVMVLCPAVPRSRLEPMLVRLRSICDQLASSDRTAQRWFSWALRRALSQGEPAPWRALKPRRRVCATLASRATGSSSSLGS
jgi:hypothetical protein